jgi:nucleotide-binding universal stress UspA family protein
MSSVPEKSTQENDALFRRILFATDFSAASGRALPFALDLSRRYGARLAVVHIIPPIVHESASLDSLSRELNLRRREAEHDMEVFLQKTNFPPSGHEVLIEEGPIWSALSSVIRRGNIDLLVLGTHGRGGVKKLILGSIAEEVVRLAPCPVLTVGPKVPMPSGAAKFGKILFATDFGMPSAKAFPYAFSLAEDFRAKLILLHMVPPMPVLDVGPSLYAEEQVARWENAAREESTRKLRELLPLGSGLAQEPEYVVAIDFVAEGILGAAAARQAELIVLGVRRTPLARAAAHIPWSVIHDVVCEANCPVLTIQD